MKSDKIIRFIICLTIVFSIGLNSSILVSAETVPEEETSAETTFESVEPSDSAIITDTCDDELSYTNFSVLDEECPDAPAVNGNGYILYDSLSKTVLLGDNIDVPMEPASTTKIVTVMIALETLQLEEVITVTPEMYESVPAGYVVLGITEGEEFTVEDLINAAMLESCNDAALALGVYMGGGSEAAFCEIMNRRCEELGCTGTHFTSCYGYSDPNNVIPVLDMALVMEQAVSYEKFCSISSSSSYTIKPTNKYGDTRVLTNTNKFICTQNYSYEYYIAGKTGYTDSAMNTIVAAANKNGRILIGVIFGATDSNIRYQNLIELFNYGYTNFTTVAIDDSDFSATYNSTQDQIEQLLVTTNLSISRFDMVLSDYHTTTTVRAQSGYSAVVELSDVIIDTSLEYQAFEIPLYRKYNDGKSYQVGVIYLEVSVKDKIVPITPEKHSIWNGIKSILVTVVTVSGLCLIIVIALLFYRRKNIKRKERKFNNKSKML